jgi:C1A family cysteine protease
MAKHSYGWRRQRVDKRDLIFHRIKSVPLVSDLDLRPEQGPVKDQGQLSSCTANGITEELEAQALMQGDPLNLLSRLFVYYNERVMEGDPDQDGGAEIRDGIKSVASLGVCAESEWPYDVSQFAVKPPDQCYADALKFRAIKYQAVPQNLDSIKAALGTARGIVLGIQVYDSFESDAVEQTGIVPMPASDESFLGGHCVRLVGYSDNGINGIPAGNFIGMNSWGTDWGLTGFFAIPYAYITDQDLTGDLWSITAVS